MAEFILKDWYGKDQTYDKETIYVQGKDGELMPFTHGTGTSAELRYVTFMSYDGLIEYGKKAVAAGDDCADPIARGVFSTPTKESDAQYNYTFYGWATIANGAADSSWNKSVTEDRTVYANFAKAVRYYTVSFYDGDTLLTTKQVAYGGTCEYSPPAKDGYFFEKWEPAPVNVTENISCYAQYKVDIDFATATWAEIAAVSERGEAETYFALGDEKEFSYRAPTGVAYTTNARIIGFYHDDLADGSGKAGITLAITNSDQMTLAMSDNDKTYNGATGLYAGSWPLCDAREKLNGYVFNYLTSELRQSIKSVKKETKRYTSGSNYENAISEDKLWVPSMKEIGHSYSGMPEEGSAYPGFSRQDKRYKNAYQTRTPGAYNQLWNNMRFNPSNGYTSSSGGTAYVVFCFCI